MVKCDGNGNGMDRMVDEAMMKHFTCTSSRTHRYTSDDVSVIVRSRLPTPLAHNASYGWRLGRSELSP